MRRFCIAVMIAWVWASGLAAGHGEEGPHTRRSSQGKGKIRIGTVAEGGGAQGTSTWVRYSFFFKHVENLERVADEKEALGNESSAAAWRAHEQLAAGLDAPEAAALKEVARECNQALEAKDAEIRSMATSFRSRLSAEELQTAPAPPELDALWQERIEIIDQQIYRLRALLGEERFQALDTYVRATFAPAVVPSGSTQGGVR